MRIKLITTLFNKNNNWERNQECNGMTEKLNKSLTSQQQRREDKENARESKSVKNTKAPSHPNNLLTRKVH